MYGCTQSTHFTAALAWAQTILIFFSFHIWCVHTCMHVCVCVFLVKHAKFYCTTLSSFAALSICTPPLLAPKIHYILTKSRTRISDLRIKLNKKNMIQSFIMDSHQYGISNNWTYLSAVQVSRVKSKQTEGSDCDKRIKRFNVLFMWHHESRPFYDFTLFICLVVCAVLSKIVTTIKMGCFVCTSNRIYLWFEYSKCLRLLWIQKKPINFFSKLRIDHNHHYNLQCCCKFSRFQSLILYILWLLTWLIFDFGVLMMAAAFFLLL